MSTKLTKAQRRVLGGLGELWMSAAGIKSRAGVKGWTARENVMAHVRSLAKLGLAEIDKTRFWRARITEAGRAALQDGKPSS